MSHPQWTPQPPRPDHTPSYADKGDCSKKGIVENKEIIFGLLAAMWIWKVIWTCLDVYEKPKQRWFRRVCLMSGQLVALVFISWRFYEVTRCSECSTGVKWQRALWFDLGQLVLAALYTLISPLEWTLRWFKEKKEGKNDSTSTTTRRPEVMPPAPNPASQVQQGMASDPPALVNDDTSSTRRPEVMSPASNPVSQVHVGTSEVMSPASNPVSQVQRGLSDDPPALEIDSLSEGPESILSAFDAATAGSGETTGTSQPSGTLRRLVRAEEGRAGREDPDAGTE